MDKPSKRQSPFQFVLDELFPIRPAIKQMFGFTYVYLEVRQIDPKRSNRAELSYTA